MRQKAAQRPSPLASCWALSCSGHWEGLWALNKKQLKCARSQVLSPGSELGGKWRRLAALSPACSQPNAQASPQAWWHCSALSSHETHVFLVMPLMSRNKAHECILACSVRTNWSRGEEQPWSEPPCSGTLSKSFSLSPGLLFCKAGPKLCPKADSPSPAAGKVPIFEASYLPGQFVPDSPSLSPLAVAFVPKAPVTILCLPICGDMLRRLYPRAQPGVGGVVSLNPKGVIFIFIFFLAHTLK